MNVGSRKQRSVFSGAAQDTRYAIRTLRKGGAFTITAVLSLALCIGAISAIFTALDAVLWRPLPVADPDKLVNLKIMGPNSTDLQDLPAALIWRLQEAGIFAGVTMFSSDGVSFVYGNDRAERVISEVVSPDYFDFVGIPTFLGEPFTSDVRQGKWAAQTVLSYTFWQRRFGGDPRVIGQTVHLNTYPFTIVGVSPPGFFGLTRGTDYELRIPLLPPGRQIDEVGLLNGSPTRTLDAAGRLKPDGTMAQAEAVVGAQFEEFNRASGGQQRLTEARRLRLLPGSKGDGGQLQQFHAPLFVLLSLAGIVLLTACANIANMMVARITGRASELAIRASIGASRARLVSLALIESVLLSVVGSAAGVLGAFWIGGFLFRFLPQGHIMLKLDLHPELRTVLFASALSLVTAAVFGLVPALQATRGDLAGRLKADTAASIGDGKNRFRKLGVGFQVAFCLVLLIVAGVFISTLSRLRPKTYGAPPTQVVLLTVKPQPEIYTPERKRRLVTEITQRVSEISGVYSAAVAENGPLGSRVRSGAIGRPGRTSVQASIDWVTPRFFDSIGVLFLSGRDFTTADEREGANNAVIVNQTLARALFANDNAVAQRVQYARGRAAPQTFEIIGIVADAPYYDLHAAPGPTAWFTFQESEPYMPTLLVRLQQADVAHSVEAIRRELNGLDRGFPVFNIKTFDTRIEESMARERMVATFSAAFGIVALALAAVGLYGILSFSVARRTREIGIRMALGCDTGAVLRLILRDALGPVGGGSIVGVLLAVTVLRAISHYVSGLSSMTFAVVSASVVITLFVSTAAVLVPAIRACRVDPLRALRYE